MKLLLEGQRHTAIRAHQQGHLIISWGPKSILQQKNFAKRQGWPTPSFGFKKAFIAKMLESDENFDLVVRMSGIDVYVPDT
jgi:hypothetical protein